MEFAQFSIEFSRSALVLQEGGYSWAEDQVMSFCGGVFGEGRHAD